MFHVASRLKELKIKTFEELFVLMILVSLLAQFNQIKISYNCRKEKWTLNELITHCVQEEEILIIISLKVFIWPMPPKTIAYILNRAPTKAAAKTPYELWTV
ncbi:hypothetical protein J1N35_012141 [Gossypium stocksii]|uniref:Uncharacterized protein n=1 Tax=Gossypium stocksii TaxID=47602 RepID=A0A9D4AE28_9ROSI|nr:hypothetical protein J1N35_012141 [Gossypium stocksii]